MRKYTLCADASQNLTYAIAPARFCDVSTWLDASIELIATPFVAKNPVRCSCSDSHEQPTYVLFLRHWSPSNKSGSVADLLYPNIPSVGANIAAQPQLYCYICLISGLTPGLVLRIIKERSGDLPSRRYFSAGNAQSFQS